MKNKLFPKTYSLFYFATKRFYAHQMVVQSASLTFYTLMAIVPLLAIIFGLAKAFGLEGFLKEGIFERFSQQKEIFEKIIPLAIEAIEKTKIDILTSFGLIFLFWYSSKVLFQVDRVFNLIWDENKKSSWRRLLGEYFSLLFFVLLFFVFSSSSTFLLFQKSRIFTFLGFFGMPLFHLTITLFSYLLPLAFFIFLYHFLPLKKVKISSACFGGVFAAFLYTIIQMIYIFFQIGVIRYGAIYGSFASLPLFLIWVQMSWMIFIYGAELTYAWECRKKIGKYKK